MRASSETWLTSIEFEMRASGAHLPQPREVALLAAGKTECRRSMVASCGDAASTKNARPGDESPGRAEEANWRDQNA
jgi:hypothetical protein